MAAWLKQWIVISKSINRKTGEHNRYVVSLGTDGHWECSCANWTFQKGGRDDCKHIMQKKFEVAYTQNAPAQFTINNCTVSATPAEVAAAVAPTGRKFRD